jgi:putative Ca2+/H+ antiporter (TMEM165/GDT1 family)
MIGLGEDVSPFVAAFVAIFLAEMVGDRSLYTISSLAARFGAARVAAGVSIAFAVKMAVAVLVGRKFAELSPSIVSAVSASAFFITAAVVYVRRDPVRSDVRRVHAAAVSFGAIFFSEWADAGQLTAAMLAARFGAPVLVWCGGTAAMLAKEMIALAVASGLRDRLRGDLLRYSACVTCVILGVLSALRIY